MLKKLGGYLGLRSTQYQFDEVRTQLLLPSSLTDYNSLILKCSYSFPHCVFPEKSHCFVTQSDQSEQCIYEWYLSAIVFVSGLFMASQASTQSECRMTHEIWSFSAMADGLLINWMYTCFFEKLYYQRANLLRRSLFPKSCAGSQQLRFWVV